MPFARRIQNLEGLYFVTFATVQWVDIFTRSTYVDILLESLRYCQKEKGLRIHAWCVMSNHVHLMISTQFGHHPSDALRDLKKFTSKKIIAAIADKEQPESRRGWMLWIFKQAGEQNAKNKEYQFWQQENHPIELISNKFIVSRRSPPSFSRAILFGILGYEKRTQQLQRSLLCLVSAVEAQ